MNTRNDTSKQLCEFLYTKNEGFGFTEEQDLEILKELFPDAREFEIIYSTKGEAHFVLRR
jgi:hypothetical protein|nr:MAG: hypothetical protein [Bacteriophage sp.]UVM86573.1 MAG: hypothetical protein [Bacteriophage sp.]UVX58829.1 MAG: hypothetical protein [Bacteriophage sp.]